MRARVEGKQLVRLRREGAAALKDDRGEHAYTCVRARVHACVYVRGSSRRHERSAAIALTASALVANSMKAKPRCVPSNFLGIRTVLRWPKAPKSSWTSFLFAWKGRLRTTSLELG